MLVCATQRWRAAHFSSAKRDEAGSGALKVRLVLATRRGAGSAPRRRSSGKCLPLGLRFHFGERRLELQDERLVGPIRHVPLPTVGSIGAACACARDVLPRGARRSPRPRSSRAGRWPQSRGAPLPRAGEGADRTSRARHPGRASRRQREDHDVHWKGVGSSWRAAIIFRVTVTKAREKFPDHAREQKASHRKNARLTLSVA